MFCQAGLGANEEVEHFPVGRRLAYDQTRGRLWVVCPRCRRWNLSPLEERWEAIEECERAFRSARLRASTENVSIARTASRMDLVRIGEPLRRELAFWRWGDRFGARRRKALVWGGISTATIAAATVGNLATGGGAFLALLGITNVTSLIRAFSGRVQVETNTGHALVLRNAQLTQVRFGRADPYGAPALVVPRSLRDDVTLTGDRALRAAAVIIPKLNQRGARDSVVREAVDDIEARGGPERYVASAWGEKPSGWKRLAAPVGRAGHATLALLPARTRVALEMALHEEEERRALNGELEGLEAMWRAAEEIADISDNLLLPKGWEAFRKKHGSPDGASD